MAYKNYILVCAGTACESSKGIALYEALEKELKAQGVDAEAQLVKTGCFGFCEQGPIVKILPDESFYVKVGPEHAQKIVSEHIIKGRKVEELLYDLSALLRHVPMMQDCADAQGSCADPAGSVLEFEVL